MSRMTPKPTPPALDAAALAQVAPLRLRSLSLSSATLDGLWFLAHSIASLEVLRPMLAANEALLLGKHAAWLHCANGILKSAAGEAVLGKVGRSGRGFTTRNWATVEKIRALMKSAG